MTLVLLPGMMCDERLFAPQIEAFDDTVVYTPVRENSMTDMAQNVLQQAPDQFDLAGLSMGGIIAMEIMRLAPKRVRRLALMDTNHRAELDAVKQARAPQIEAANTGRLSAVMREEMKPRYLVDGPNKSRILDICMDMAMDLGAEAFVNQSNALMDRRDQSDTLAAISCPVLVMCGAYDQLCPVSRHEEMANIIPNATLTLIENAAHLPTLENPTQTTAALRSWLEAV
ncbi:alpha/beta hydrolase [Amylibacter marinus]|uniref:Alpha/beta hydrolase n=1 Tax=Amylibacter marinus TaxID=1475483 RepID=A0ABQ5VY41_9RHOB|nr:alpha/beta hydrolase [Amylibacter marinus]